MCSPTLAIMAVMVIGTIIQAQGEKDEGAAAKQAADYRSAVARNNAILAERAAGDAEARGQIESDLRRRMGRQQIGRATVQLASGGQVVNQGSALDLVVDIAEITELDALTITNVSAREALNFRQQGSNFQNDAEFLTLQGKNAKKAADTKALGTLITGFASAGAGAAGGFGGGGTSGASLSRFGTAGAGQGFSTSASGTLLGGI